MTPDNEDKANEDKAINRSNYYIAYTNQLIHSQDSTPPGSRDRVVSVIDTIKHGCMVGHYMESSPVIVDLQQSIRQKIDDILCDALLTDPDPTFPIEKSILEGMKAWIDVGDWYNAGLYMGGPTNKFSDELVTTELPQTPTVIDSRFD